MSPHPALPQNVDLGLISCHILHIANNRGAKLYQASSFAQLQNATKKNYKEELYFGIQFSYHYFNRTQFERR